MFNAVSTPAINADAADCVTVPVEAAYDCNDVKPNPETFALTPPEVTIVSEAVSPVWNVNAAVVESPAALAWSKMIPL